MGLFDKFKKKNATKSDSFLYSEEEINIIESHMKKYFKALDSDVDMRVAADWQTAKVRM